MSNALYHGAVVHRRNRPKAHALRYKVFALCIDLDAVPDLAKTLRLLSVNRFGLFAFHDRDHGPGDGSPLRPWVERLLRESGMGGPVGRVRLLCYPRILGYVFNPLSVYFCDRPDGSLLAILYEVSNTYGERHTYVISAGDGPVQRQECAKSFYVSPFIAMEGTYRFHVLPPAETVTIGIRQSDPEGPLLTAVFNGRRESLNDRSLLRAFFRYPLMTLKVIGGIHWEALKLWRKGIPVVRHVPAPAKTYSSGHPVVPAIEEMPS